VLAAVVDHLKVEHKPQQQAAVVMVKMQLILRPFLEQPIQVVVQAVLLVVHLAGVTAVLEL
jgi:hypothetical protein